MLLKLCELILPSVHFSGFLGGLIVRTSLQRKKFTAVLCYTQKWVIHRYFEFWVFAFRNLSPKIKCSVVLRSEIASGICAKLRTVAASNNRVHMPWSLCYCLFAPHIRMVLFFTHIPFVVNHTINATPPERLQQWHWLKVFFDPDFLEFWSVFVLQQTRL